MFPMISAVRSLTQEAGDEELNDASSASGANFKL
jgi:hypothetical protein